jgi:hypothetical protein
MDHHRLNSLFYLLILNDYDLKDCVVDSDADRKKKGGGERSDSIMILSINPKTKKTEIDFFSSTTANNFRSCITRYTYYFSFLRFRVDR